MVRECEKRIVVFGTIRTISLGKNLRERFLEDVFFRGYSEIVEIFGEGKCKKGSLFCVNLTVFLAIPITACYSKVPRVRLRVTQTYNVYDYILCRVDKFFSAFSATFHEIYYSNFLLEEFLSG